MTINSRIEESAHGNSEIKSKDAVIEALKKNIRKRKIFKKEGK